ncbi:MAG: DUF4184 family protein [Candidatus Bathyarchaeales archaeon]
MPITPLHLSAFIFLYFKDKRRIDPLALAVSTTSIDLEPLYYFLLGEPLDHRLWHGFTLALTIYPVLVAFGVYIAERLLETKLLAVYGRLVLNPVKAKYPFWNIYLLSLFGGFSHIFLDMFTHPEMFWVLYPFANGNPFYNRWASIAVEAVVILLSIYSLNCWLKDKPVKLSAKKLEFFCKHYQPNHCY